MARACDCNASLSNSGKNCTPLMDIAYRFWAMPLIAADGTRNSIDTTQTLNQAYWDALINHADPTKRIYPLLAMKNVRDERGESIKETFEDQSTEFVQQGVAAVNALFADGNGTQIYLGQLEQSRCVEHGLFTIDLQGNLIGTIGTGQDDCAPTLLYPVAVDKGSWDPRLMKKTNTTTQKLMLSFNWAITEEDRNLRMITADEAGIDLRLLNGLQDVCMVLSDIDNDTFTADLRVTNYGTMINPIRVEGLVIGDFSLYNDTDSAPVTILTCTETEPGIYVFTFAPQTNADVLNLTPTQTGYDFTAVIAEDIEMPAT